VPAHRSAKTRAAFHLRPPRRHKAVAWLGAAGCADVLLMPVHELIRIVHPLMRIPRNGLLMSLVRDTPGSSFDHYQ
jgi:hypothetical protein